MVLLAWLIQLKFPNAPRQTWIGVLRPLLPLVVCTFAWSDCAIIILRFNGRKLNTNKLNWDLTLLQQTKLTEFVAMLCCWCDGYLWIRKVACCSYNSGSSPLCGGYFKLWLSGRVRECAFFSRVLPKGTFRYMCVSIQNQTKRTRFWTGHALIVFTITEGKELTNSNQ